MRSTLPGPSDEQDFVPLHFAPRRKPWGRWLLRALLLICAVAAAAATAAVLLWALATDGPLPTTLVLTLAIGPFLLLIAGGAQFRSARLTLLASGLAFAVAVASAVQWWTAGQTLATRTEHLRIVGLLTALPFLLVLFALLLYRARPRRIRYPRM